MVDWEKRILEQDRKLQRSLFGTTTKKKKRVKLTPSQRLYVWEHPKMYGRTCNICHQRITKQSEMELDHTHPYSKGGTKMNLAHKECNRMKGSKSLGHVQKKMGFKNTKKKKPVKRKTTPKKKAIKKKPVKRKTTKKKTKRKPKNSFGGWGI